METAEYNLKEINRQAKDSPIIRLSMDIRNGKFVPYGKYGKFVHKIHAEDLDDELLLKGSKILCGKNDTRTNVNKYIRKLKGYDLKAMPYKDEPIIGTGNVLTSGLFNGQEWLSDVDASNYKLTNSMDVSMRFRNEIDRVRHNRVIFPQDNLYKSESKGYVMEMIKENDIYPVDFAYAVTVHKCVPINTLVFTKSGLVTMKHLNNDAPPGLFKVYKEPVDVVSNGKLKPVRAFFNNGLDIVSDFTTNLGYSLTATSDHRIKVYDINSGVVKSKVMDQININGDNKIAFIINKGFNIFDGKYQKILINGNEEIITEGLAELIGLYHSIGSINSNGELIFGTHNTKIATRIITMIRSYFGTANIDSFTHFVLTKDEKVIEFFKNLTTDVHAILTSPKSVQNRFMLGLFANGNITKLHKKYSMTSIGKSDLYKVIHVALLNYGIISKLSERGDNISFLTFEGDNLKLLLNTFGEYDDMGSTINYFEYNGLVEPYNPTYPVANTLKRLSEAANIDLLETPDNRYSMNVIREVLKSSVNLSDSAEYRFLNDLSNGKIFIDEVVSKSKLYTTHTYCLQMKDRNDPWFNQNGILAGNCQGSSYPFPIVYEEHLGNKDFHKKFMYTAVTRAEKKLLLVSD